MTKQAPQWNAGGTHSIQGDRPVWQQRPLFLQPELNPLLMSQKTTQAIFLRVHAAVGGGQGGQTHRHLLGSYGNA